MQLLIQFYEARLIIGDVHQEWSQSAFGPLQSLLLSVQQKLEIWCLNYRVNRTLFISLMTSGSATPNPTRRAASPIFDRLLNTTRLLCSSI